MKSSASVGSTITPAKFTRRDLLRGAGRLAVAAAAAGLMPPNVRRMLAQSLPQRPSSLRDVKHVVMLMQENRSFDHYFGTLAGVRGFGDTAAFNCLPANPFFINRTIRIRKNIYFHFTWTLAPRARRRFRQQVTHGTCSMRPGIAARWTNGCQFIARPMV